MPDKKGGQRSLSPLFRPPLDFGCPMVKLDKKLGQSVHVNAHF